MMGSALCSSALATIWYAYFRWATRESRHLSDSQRARFPLGSLGSWVDLLLVNRCILKDADARSGLCVQWVGASKSWAVTKAEHVEKVLTTSQDRTPPHSGNPEAAIALSAGTFHIKMFMGFQSVGVLDGPEWRKIRNHMSRYVQSSSHLKAQFACIHTLANEAMDYFLSPQRPASQEVSHPLFTMAYDILANAVFGEHSGFLRQLRDTGDTHPVVHALAKTMHEMTRRMGSFNPLDWLYVLDGLRPSQRAFVHAYKTVWAYVAEIVARRRTDQAESFLFHLAKSESDRLIFDNVQTCMWAGHESTAAALSFTLHELASRPDLQEALEAEVVGVTGPSRELRYEHMHELKLVTAVMEESLRLHPPAIWTNRALSEDLHLDGERLPRGSVVLVPIHAVHRSPLNWENPEEFLPERFLHSAPVPGSHVPFGMISSRRVCPGYRLAPFELRVALATFALRGLRVSRDAAASSPVIRANGAFQLCLENYLQVSSSCPKD